MFREDDRGDSTAAKRPFRTPRWFVVAGLLCAAAFLCGCRRGASDARATVEIRNGIRFVKNQLRQVPEQAPPALIEDLVIGAGGGARAPILFRGVLPYRSVDVDTSGNIYIADAAALQIVMVDPGGTLVRTIGREGQGPGEFQSLSALRVLAGDRLAVYDGTNGRLSVFDPDGGLSEEVSLAVHPALFSAQIDSGGNVFGLKLTMDGPVRTLALLKISADGTASAPIASVASRLSPAGSVRLFALSRLEFGLTPLDGVVWGNQSDYVLHILDGEGRPEAVIEKAFVPLAVRAVDIEAELSRRRIRRQDGVKTTAPDRLPAFSMLLVADDGRIFAQVHERTTRGLSFAYDVFDGQGFYLYRMRMKGTPVLIKAGRLYAVDEDEEGALLIKRYAMK